MSKGIRACATLTILLTLVCTTFAHAASGADEGEFVRIFDGESLDGWACDETIWSVQDGAIVGETEEDESPSASSFCIWDGGDVEDFILTYRARLLSGNSGVQYRSGSPEKWKVSGYQQEISMTPADAGELHHSGDRHPFPGLVGEFSRMSRGDRKQVIGQAANTASIIKLGYFRPKKWNSYTVVARGNNIAQYVNGFKTAETLDYAQNRKRRGVIALQVHGGGAMRVEFKDIRLKKLTHDYGRARRLFDANTLDGWTTSSGGRQGWKVEDARLVHRGEPNGYLHTKEKFKNYVLRFQWRHLEKGSAGAVVRMQPSDAENATGVRIDLGTGRAGEVRPLGDVQLRAGDRKDGNRIKTMGSSNVREPRRWSPWNECELVVNGSEVKVYINRKLQNHVSGCAEKPGHIALQSGDARIEYRNIVLIPIKGRK